MGFRIGFYLTVLTVGLLAAMGFGLLDQVGPTTRRQSAVSAAPLGTHENSADNEAAEENVSDAEENGAEENSVDNSDDNNAVVESSPPPSTPPGTDTGGGTTIVVVAPPVTGAGPCTFILGFLTLHNMLLSIGVNDGGCVTSEFHGDNGDGLQITNGGLYVWRKLDNWTAYTNGHQTWLNGPCGLQTRLNTDTPFNWEGRIGGACV